MVLRAHQQLDRARVEALDFEVRLRTNDAARLGSGNCVTQRAMGMNPGEPGKAGKAHFHPSMERCQWA